MGQGNEFSTILMNSPRPGLLADAPPGLIYERFSNDEKIYPNLMHSI